MVQKRLCTELNHFPFGLSASVRILNIVHNGKTQHIHWGTCSRPCTSFVRTKHRLQRRDLICWIYRELIKQLHYHRSYHKHTKLMEGIPWKNKTVSWKIKKYNFMHEVTLDIYTFTMTDKLNCISNPSIADITP